MLQFSANIVAGGELLPRIWALVPLTVQRWGFGANGDNNDSPDDDDEMVLKMINLMPMKWWVIPILQVEFIATLSADLTSACPRGCSGTSSQ